MFRTLCASSLGQTEWGFVYSSHSRTEEHHWHLTQRILEQLKINPVQYQQIKKNFTASGRKNK